MLMLNYYFISLLTTEILKHILVYKMFSSITNLVCFEKTENNLTDAFVNAQVCAKKTFHHIKR